MTNIKEVIHLYLGCEVLLESEMYGENGKPDRIMERLAGIDKNGGYEGDKHILYDDDFKLRLRRLDSMSEAEGYETLTRNCIFQVLPANNEMPADRFISYRLDYGTRRSKVFHEYFPVAPKTPAAVLYLLKQGFWLFGDEAFEQGLIIDKNLKP